jgi:hypothetical protein
MAVISSPGRDHNPARPRAPMGASRLRQNYTQAQIERAVEGMMMRLSTGHGFDVAAARQVAQLIGPYVNDANTGIPPGGVLIGNQAFERMVLEKAPALLSDTNDPATRAALARLAQQQNASASPLLTPAQMAALGLAGGFAGGGTGSRDSSPSSYSRAQALADGGGSTGGVSPAVIAQYTQQYSGMGFGSDMIRTFADVQLSRRDFDDLVAQGLKRSEIAAAAKDTKGMGLKGEGDVRAAHYATPGVKSHLKKAYGARNRGDNRGEEREVGEAGREAEKAKDAREKDSDKKLIEDYRARYQLKPDDEIAKPKENAAAKKIFDQLKAKSQASPKP